VEEGWFSHRLPLHLPGRSLLGRYTATFYSSTNDTPAHAQTAFYRDEEDALLPAYATRVPAMAILPFCLYRLPCHFVCHHTTAPQYRRVRGCRYTQSRAVPLAFYCYCREETTPRTAAMLVTSPPPPAETTKRGLRHTPARLRACRFFTHNPTFRYTHARMRCLEDCRYSLL